MVGFHPHHRSQRLVAAVGFAYIWCWWLSVSFLVGFSQSLSTPSVSTTGTAGPFRSSTVASAAGISSTNDNNEACPHYKWLIIGGGIHGVGIAARLVGAGKVHTTIGENRKDSTNRGEELLVVDEHPKLLHSWKERTRATGMAFLRSSAGFHLDVPAQGLKEFAGDYHTQSTTASHHQKRSKKAQRKAKNNRNKGSNPSGSFVGSDYQRPALELFNDHCDLVVKKYGLDDCFFRGRVESIDCDGGSNGSPSKVVIATGSDATVVSADNIVLAVGNDDPLFPEWATDLASQTTGDSGNHKISHLLQISDDFEQSGASDEQDDDSNQKGGQPRVVVIIGGGISAVHKALQLTSVDNMNNQKKITPNGKANANASNTVVVHIVSRHPVREQQFDTHQDWMMTQELAQRSLEKGGKGLTKRQTEFGALEAPSDRRAVILRERIPGTVPTYMTRARGGLEEAIAQGKIHWHVAGVASAATVAANESKSSPRRYQLDLTNGNGIAADEIILATGLGKRPPGHSIIHPLAEQAGLPLSRCGYPLVDASLEWKPNHKRFSGGNDSDSSSHNNSSRNIGSKIFVSGGLAELELGPSARNIAGARMAAERIAGATDPPR